MSIRIMEKEIDVENSEILIKGPQSMSELNDKWEFENGEWGFKDGWLTGKFLGNAGGILYSKEGFDCDVLLDFIGRTVAPCENDLNFTWCSEGWDYAKDDAGISYIAGLGGWWENKTGIEHYPECTLRAATSSFKLEAGKTYHIQAGSIKGHCFIFVDSVLVIEMFDPNPIDTSLYNKVGIGTYASHIQVKDFTARKISWKPIEMSYIPNFE